MQSPERGNSTCVYTPEQTNARTIGWFAALIIALVVVCAPQAARGQSLVYAYTGSPFVYSDCTAHFGSPPPTCVSSGSITAQVTFNNVPSGYTGAVNAASGSGGTSGFCGQAGISPTAVCVASMTAYASGVNIARTVFDPTGTTGSSLQFGFSSGAITSWLITIQDVSVGTNVIGINNYGMSTYDFAETSAGSAGLNATAGTWSFVMDAMKTCSPCMGAATGGSVAVPGVAATTDPIILTTGNVHEDVQDYTTVGQNPLSFTRYYNSRQVLDYPTTYATTLGPNWRSTFDRYLNKVSASIVNAERPDGRVVTFTLVSSVWTPDTDVDMTLTNSGSTWTLTDHDDTVESYTVSGSKGTLNTITARDGYQLTLSYSSGLLSSVSDSYSRSLGFTYSSGLLTNVTTPDSSSPGINYGYTSGLLTSVEYPTSTGGTTLTYVYGNSSFLYALTGITDQNSNAYATFNYDNEGRATESYLGGSGIKANDTQVDYSPASGCAMGASVCTSVTNALSVVDTYSFTTSQDVPKVTQISRSVPGGTSAPPYTTRSFTYDGNGYLETASDWNGNFNQYTNDSHGDPTYIYEGIPHGDTYSSATRTTTITYDRTWVHLPDCITVSGMTTAFQYYNSAGNTGNVETRAETDTASGGTACATSAATHTRVWTYNTYTSTGQLEKVTDPLSNVTQWSYSGGSLASITDAASHTTTINTSTNGGQPIKITDPNSVVTYINYDFFNGGAMKPLNSTVNYGSSPTYETQWAYDSAGNLTQKTLPDSSYLKYAYDNAHRVTEITNANTECIVYTLDQLSDATEADTKSPVSSACNSGTGTLTRKRTASFDGLGRKLTDTTWQTSGSSIGSTTYAYDGLFNATSIEDARSNTAYFTYDPLNRVTQAKDRLSNITYATYDPLNRVLTVKDPLGNTTTYTRDGFGRATSIASPDSGTTSYVYDKDSNLTGKTDAASNTVAYTYDALNRMLTKTYNGAMTPAVTYTYDAAPATACTGGFSYTNPVGHLTSMADISGATSGCIDFAYEQRGYMYYESRIYGLYTLATSIYRDGAGRIWEIILPDGWTEGWARDSAGQVTEVATIPPGGGSFTALASSITHEPFGPVTSMAFYNGITRTATYDMAYRTERITDAGSGGSPTILDLVYGTTSSGYTTGYDANNNLLTLTDNVGSSSFTTTGGSQGYDADDQFLGNDASSAYGTFTLTYDANHNIASLNGDAYTYNSGGNQLATDAVYGYAFTGYQAGNIATVQQPLGTNLVCYAYDPEERLSTATNGCSGSPAVTYTYDGFGNRFAKNNGSVITGFTTGPNGNLLEEINTANTATDYVYLDPSGADAFYPVGVIEQTLSPSSGAVYYTHADRLGVPQYITDGSKTVQWSAAYYPTGDLYGVTASINANLVLPGMNFDAETGLYHNGAREYIPDVGRYLETDPIGLGGGTTNTYTYAGDNPLRWTDKTGTQVWEEPAAIWMFAEIWTGEGGNSSG